MRFESYNTITTFCTKYQDPSRYPPFDKQMSRQRLEEKEQRHLLQYMHDYDPDFSQVREHHGCHVNFKK